jgi:hypothetical protein
MRQVNLRLILVHDHLLASIVSSIDMRRQRHPRRRSPRVKHRRWPRCLTASHGQTIHRSYTQTAPPLNLGNPACKPNPAWQWAWAWVRDCPGDSGTNTVVRGALSGCRSPSVCIGGDVASCTDLLYKEHVRFSKDLQCNVTCSKDTHRDRSILDTG